MSVIELTRSCFFLLSEPASPAISALPLHDALPISRRRRAPAGGRRAAPGRGRAGAAVRGAGRRRAEPPPQRSEEHTSELQSRRDLVCRLLLEKKKAAST